MLWLSQGYQGDGVFYCEDHKDEQNEPLLIQDAESDSPTTCDECHTLIGCLDYNCRNTIPCPLTDEGVRYVREMIVRYNKTGEGNSDLICDLKEAYPEIVHDISAELEDEIAELQFKLDSAEEKLEALKEEEE